MLGNLGNGWGNAGLENGPIGKQRGNSLSDR